MTDAAARLDVIEAEIRALREMLQASATTKQLVASRRPRWELAARAFRRFGFEPHTIRRICSSHPEWAKRLTDGAWYVDADLFDEFAARVERGEASFAVSAKSALSVESDGQSLFSYEESNPTDDEAERNK